MYRSIVRIGELSHHRAIRTRVTTAAAAPITKNMVLESILLGRQRLEVQSGDTALRGV